MLWAVQEFDITGIPQRITQGDVVNIQTTWWDQQEEGVLLFETKDLLGRLELRSLAPRTVRKRAKLLDQQQTVLQRHVMSVPWPSSEAKTSFWKSPAPVGRRRYGPSSADSQKRFEAFKVFQSAWRLARGPRCGLPKAQRWHAPLRRGGGSSARASHSRGGPV